MRIDSVKQRHFPSSTKNCLFVGVVAVATSAFAWRQWGKRAVTTRRYSTPSVSTSTPVMFGGGKGVSVRAPGPASATVIFLHGLGDSGYGWASAFPLEGLDHVQAVLPSAGDKPVSLNGNMRMPAWSDIKGLDANAPDDEEGILESVDRIDRIIDEQVRSGIPEDRIVVGGFSQGGAITLTFALRTERRLAGIIALSSWLPLRHQYPEKLSTGSKDVPMFMGHGNVDPVVDFYFGQSSAKFVEGLERKVEFRSYGGLGHSASPQEFEDVRNFIAKVLPPKQ